MTVCAPSLWQYTIAAQASDDRWFRDHPRATWRVRPCLPAESSFLADMADRMGGVVYAIVIDHGRAGDKRKAAPHRGVYPILITAHVPRGRRKRVLKEQALAMMAHFRRSASTPPPPKGAAFVFQL